MFQVRLPTQFNMNQMFKSRPLSHFSGAVVLLVWMPSAVIGNKRKTVRCVFGLLAMLLSMP